MPSPRGESAGLELGHATARVEANDAEREVPQQRDGQDGVAEGRQPRNPCGHAGQAREPAERVVAEGSHSSPVRAIQDLGAVASHVNPRRAVGRAGLAREAQVEGLEDLGGVDGAHEARVGGLLKDSRPPAGHVLLLPGRQVGGAHEGSRYSRAALADSGAAVDGGREVAPVAREGEASIGRHGVCRDAAQVGVEGIDAGLALEGVVGSDPG